MRVDVREQKQLEATAIRAHRAITTIRRLKDEGYVSVEYRGSFHDSKTASFKSEELLKGVIKAYRSLLLDRQATRRNTPELVLKRVQKDITMFHKKGNEFLISL